MAVTLEGEAAEVEAVSMALEVRAEGIGEKVSRGGRCGEEEWWTSAHRTGSFRRDTGELQVRVTMYEPPNCHYHQYVHRYVYIYIYTYK